jgi:hypothetical protein
VAACGKLKTPEKPGSREQMISLLFLLAPSLSTQATLFSFMQEQAKAIRIQRLG